MSQFSEVLSNQINQAIEILQNCFSGGGKLLVCGNGGSASDAEHITTELMKKFIIPRKGTIDGLEPGLPAICLNSNNALITAIANDIGYDSIFSQQINVYGAPGDVLLAISTSGKSANIIEALRVARQNRLRIILMTGTEYASGVNLDCAIQAEENSTHKIQEVHVKIYHEICEKLEKHFFLGK